MSKLFKRCFLTAKDLGLEKYSVAEIADKMKPVENIHEQDPLYGFANSLTDFFNIETKESNKNTNSRMV